jgi:hypothetical protein
MPALRRKSRRFIVSFRFAGVHSSEQAGVFRLMWLFRGRQAAV